MNLSSGKDSGLPSPNFWRAIFLRFILFSNMELFFQEKFVHYSYTSL
jgi:hypothetical protein